MSKYDIIRAWKDSSFFASLSAAQQRALPANPAGSVSVDDAALAEMFGAGGGGGGGGGSCGGCRSRYSRRPCCC